MKLKRTFILFLLAGTWMAFHAPAAKSQTLSTSFTPTASTVDTGTFGSGGTSCKGMSRCIPAYSPGPATGMLMNLAYDANTSVMALTFNIHDLKKGQPDKVKYFKGKTCTFTADWVLSARIVKELKIKSPAVIKAGVPYEVTKNGDIYGLMMKVEKMNAKMKKKQ